MSRALFLLVALIVLWAVAEWALRRGVLAARRWLAARVAPSAGAGAVATPVRLVRCPGCGTFVPEATLGAADRTCRSCAAPGGRAASR